MNTKTTLNKEFIRKKLDEALAFVCDPDFVSEGNSLKPYYPLFEHNTVDIISCLSNMLKNIFPVITLLLYRSRLSREILDRDQNTNDGAITDKIMALRNQFVDLIGMTDVLTTGENAWDMEVMDITYQTVEQSKYMNPWMKGHEGFETNSLLNDDADGIEEQYTSDIAQQLRKEEAFIDFALKSVKEEAMLEADIYAEQLSNGSADAASYDNKIVNILDYMSTGF